MSAPPPPHAIDLDTESIQYDGHWYTREELARKIKAMLDAGDFAVGKPSQALEQLTVTLSSLRTVAVKLTPEMADAVNQAAARQGRSVGGILREAIADYLGFAAMPAREPPAAARGTSTAERHGRKQTDPEIPAIPHPVPADLKTTQQMGVPSSVIAGPGALRAAQPPPPLPVASVEVESAGPDEEASKESVERGWFGR